MIKIFRGAGVVTPSKPPPPTNNFFLYPPPVFKCFWKDPLMTPTPHFKHLSLLPPPHPPPLPPQKFLSYTRWSLQTIFSRCTSGQTIYFSIFSHADNFFPNHDSPPPQGKNNGPSLRNSLQN